MAQRIEFRFGKNSSFECDTAQLASPLEVVLLGRERSPWARVISSSGGERWINTARCTQIILGLPDKEAT